MRLFNIRLSMLVNDYIVGPNKTNSLLQIMRESSLKVLLIILAFISIKTSVAQEMDHTANDTNAKLVRTDEEYEALIIESEKELRDTRTNADILNELFKPIQKEINNREEQITRLKRFEFAEIVLVGLLVLVSLLILFLTYQLVQMRRRRQLLLECEKQIEQILSQVLPNSEVDKVVNNSTTEPAIWSDCLVVYLEVKFHQKFRTTNDRMIAVNKAFQIIEDRLSNHGLIKVKSSADKILAVHKVNNVAAHQQLQNTLEALKESQTRIEASKEIRADLRCGLDYGSVFSAMVGKEKLGFDIWGTAVNRAFLILESASTNQIICSEEVSRIASISRVKSAPMKEKLNYNQEAFEVFEIVD